MKRLLAVLLAVLMVLSVSVLFAAAEDDASAEVFVTISDNEGNLALAAEKITVTDIDDDGALTVNDTLYAAHELFYEGGAAAGYETEMTKYGLSLVRLWGTANGYNYGYYINNESAWSMTDVVVDGDYVAAYCITDLETFADRYSYFDKFNEDIEAGEVTLTLTKADYDEDWNSITVPVEGAVITVDGEAADVVTDAEGVATVALTVNGKHIVSAEAPEEQIIVPPVYVANVTGGEDPEPVEEPTDEPTEVPAEIDTEEPTEEVTEEAETVAPTQEPTKAATKDSATKDTATKDSGSKSSSSSSSTPKTGDNTNMRLWMIITMVCLIGIGATVMIYRKRYEK